jgi:hypothetical protein
MTAVHCVQAVLAARKVMRQYYDAELRSDDDAVPCHSRDISLAAQSTKSGACAPGTCPLDPDCRNQLLLGEPAYRARTSHGSSMFSACWIARPQMCALPPSSI